MAGTWNRAIVRSVALAAIAVAVYLGVRHRVGHSGTQIAGSPTRSLAPDFSLPDLAGNQVRLSSYRGKVVLLDFWATWCDPCRDEIPRFVELQNQYNGQGLQIIGVSMDDSPEPVRDFRQKFQITYPVLMGNAKTGDLYGGILGLPILFLLDREGRICSKHIGATDLAALEREIQDQLRLQ